MDVKLKVLWVPTVVSAMALVAGIGGIVVMGDWRLLLTIPAAVGATELAVASKIKLNGARLEGPLKDFPIPLHWFDCFRMVFLFSSLYFVFDHAVACFSSLGDPSHWVQVCVYGGMVLLPWGYRYGDAEEKFGGWLFFGVVLGKSVLYALRVPYRNEIAVLFGALFFIVIPTRHYLRFWKGGKA